MNWEFRRDEGLMKIYASLQAEIFNEERWFADREIPGRLVLVDSLQFCQDGSFLTLNLFRFNEAEYLYYIPLWATKNPELHHFNLLFEADNYYFADAVPSIYYANLLEELLGRNKTYETGLGSYQFQAYPSMDHTRVQLHGASSNSLLFVSRQLLFKNYRRLYPGINPELEMTIALTELGSENTPQVHGFFQYISDKTESKYKTEYTLGLVQQFIPNRGTGWDIWKQIIMDDFKTVDYRGEAYSLGETLARLHLQLAQISQSKNRYQPLETDRILAKIARLIGQADTFGGDLHQYVIPMVEVLQGIQWKITRVPLGHRFLIHGDLHLEQVLMTDSGWIFIDFEGEPLKSVANRGNFDSPIKDLASMLRSISYRVNSSEINVLACEDLEKILVAEFLQGYLETYRKLNGGFLPSDDVFYLLLQMFQLERVIYEIEYEKKYRPDWLRIPLSGLRNLLKGMSTYQ